MLVLELFVKCMGQVCVVFSVCVCLCVPHCAVWLCFAGWVCGYVSKPFPFLVPRNKGDKGVQYVERGVGC